jgi:hypothetical protein
VNAPAPRQSTALALASRGAGFGAAAPGCSTGQTQRDFRRRAEHIGIDAITTPVRAPKANAIAERVIGTLRRECLDHIIALNEQHLTSVLTEFVRDYTQDRPHRTLGLQTPELRPRPVTGPICSRPVLNGLHHAYERAA